MSRGPGGPPGAPARARPARPGPPGARFLLIFDGFSLIFDGFLLIFNPWGPLGDGKIEKIDFFGFGTTKLQHFSPSIRIRARF